MADLIKKGSKKLYALCSGTLNLIHISESVADQSVIECTNLITAVISTEMSTPRAEKLDLQQEMITVAKGG